MPGKRFWLIGILLLLVLAGQPVLVVGQGPDDPNSIQIEQANSQERYIVVFKEGIGRGAVDQAADAVARTPGGAVHFRYSAALHGFAATVPGPALQGLRHNPNVAYIEPDSTVSLYDTQEPATWGIDRIDQRALPLSNSYTYSNTGAGVTAYIIDTGIRVTHAEFGGRASVGFDGINDGRNGIDCNGHGTHVAGTVGGSTYGVAKQVNLVAVRVIGCGNFGWNSVIVAGVDWVTANHAMPAVANMSLGGSASRTLDTAVKAAIASGVTFAVAAGNENRGACRGSPARVGPAITVGATDSTDARAYYSNFGFCLDLFAPGSGITSAWKDGDNDTSTISGTSMATPHVTGTAALFLQGNPTASPLEVRNGLVAGATVNTVKNAGFGSPNRLLFTNY